LLVDELKKVKQKNTLQKDRLKEAIRKIDNQEKTQADVDRRKAVIREIRHENNERMRQGLPPIFKTRVSSLCMF
uniref:rRNA biogenesis protein RRP36 n=1 Tax=Gongylonema pulchrum TaxID=637853 RepID=A0A183EAP5_9BILA